MSASKQSQIEKLKVKVARLEADIAANKLILDGHKAKLAAFEAGQTVARASAASKVLDLSPLWDAALEMSRKRSSMVQCLRAWARIPAAARPTIEAAVAALKAWNQDHEWIKEGNAFALALHRFIERRLWENAPKIRPAPSRARQATKVPEPVPRPEDLATDDEIQGMTLDI